METWLETFQRRWATGEHRGDLLREIVVRLAEEPLDGWHPSMFALIIAARLAARPQTEEDS